MKANRIQLDRIKNPEAYDNLKAFEPQRILTTKEVAERLCEIAKALKR